MVNVACSPSCIKAYNTTAAQLLIMESLHGAQLPTTMTVSSTMCGEIVIDVSAHGYE